MEEGGVLKCSPQEFLFGEWADGNEYLWLLLWEIDVLVMETRWNTAEFVEGPKESREWIVPSTFMFGAVRKRMLEGEEIPENVFSLVEALVNNGVRQFVAKVRKINELGGVGVDFLRQVENGQ